MQQLAEISGVRGVARGGVLHIVLGLIFAAGLALQLPFALNHDAAWHFETSFRLLHGARFGDGVYDVNPPMSAWLFLLPAAICDATGASPTLVFKLFTFAMMLGAIAATVRLLPIAAPEIDDPLVALAALAIALVLVPAYDFGQREHLVSALTLPYVILAAARARGATFPAVAAVGIGFAAALGIGVKPYFLMLPVCIEAWLFVIAKRRVIRPELVTMAVTLLIYLVAVQLFAPDYLWRVVPDAMIAYSAFQVGWPDLARDFAIRLGPYLIGVGILAVALRGRLSLLLQACMAAALGFLFAAVLQRKGWAYQTYPVAMYCLFFAGVAFSVPALRKNALRSVAWAAAILAFAGGVSIVSFVRDGIAPDGTTARVRALTALFREYGSVYAFITSPRDIHPAVLESHARWTSASGVLVFLPAMLDTPGNAAVHAVGTRRDLETVAELYARHPRIIVVDAETGKLGIRQPDFDYLRFFARYPGFAAFMRNYVEQERIGDFRVFRYAPPASSRAISD